jgi:hypothetical protein
MSIAPTQIHFAVSIPKATGSDYKKEKVNWYGQALQQ